MQDNSLVGWCRYLSPSNPNWFTVLSLCLLGCHLLLSQGTSLTVTRLRMFWREVATGFSSPVVGYLCHRLVIWSLVARAFVAGLDKN
jgi:hypothetical protein